MGIEVSVVRVFTDENGKHGNPLGIVDASTVAESDRQAVAKELDYSETIFIDVPDYGASRARVQIFTPAVELPFAGHPTVGATWWLGEQGRRVTALDVPAGSVDVRQSGALTWVRARAEWAPEFAIYPMDTVDDVIDADPSDYEARLLALADQFVKQVKQAEALTNDAPDIAAKRRAAAEALKDSEFEKAEALFAEIAEAHLETGRRDVLAAASAVAEQGGAARLRGDLLDAAGRYARAAELAAPFDAEATWFWRFIQADILDDHGKLFPGPSQAEAVRIWRDLCLPHTPRDRRPVDWAMTQNNLGNALATQGNRLGGEAGAGALADAVAAYKAALEVYTRTDMPPQWAMTQNNLGNALQALGERRGGEAGAAALADAVAAYAAALEVYTRADMPADWAMAQNNLGNALRTLGERLGGEAGRTTLADAVAAYELALEVYNRKEMPAQWATTQNNLGNALRALGDRSGGEAGAKALADAVAAYEAALEVYARKDMPADWAMTQNNLGVALRALGERSAGEAAAAALVDAVAAYEAALEVYTRADMPADWAATQNNLGNALATLGNRLGDEAGTAALADAAAAYEAALEVYTRKDMPADWAMTQNNLGIALQALGERRDGQAGVAALADAVTAHRAALEVRTRADMPADWATTQNNLGNALAALGAHLGGDAGTKALVEAVAAHEAALEVRTRTDMPPQWAMTTANLCMSQNILARWTDQAEPACAAAERMKAVVVEFEAMGADAWSERAGRMQAMLIETCCELGGVCAD